MLKKRLGQEGALFKELGQKHDAKEDPLIADLVSKTCRRGPALVALCSSGKGLLYRLIKEVDDRN